MSSLKYYVPEGHCEERKVKYYYTQAVRVGDRIETSGQARLTCGLGGWHPKTGVIHTNLKDEIDEAFRNCELNLKTAGGKGWSQVFRVTSYHVPLTDEALEICVENFKKYMPDHQPVWTAVGVPALGSPEGHIEIECNAYDPEGAAKAAQ
ncbi:unnamed protein product [Clonostachys byssicola]|uniref:Uncharacterized protein n=1 Tax=Clonostachys byssicola TaxID=160290 RepID=A0A9N9Y3D8_9HYPO|nr:unnamed protein product [Clonostachys byssicola]